MKRRATQRARLASLVAGMMLILWLPMAGANGQLSNPEGWIDKLTVFVVFQKAAEHQGNFDPYLTQIRAMRRIFKEEWVHGDLQGTYAAMGRLMDMLQAREGGIRAEAAAAIWDFCYQVTPIVLHDRERHPITLDSGWR